MASTSRVENLKEVAYFTGVLIPFSIVGLVSTGLDLVSLGRIKALSEMARIMQDGVGTSIGGMSQSLIRSINPNAEEEEWFDKPYTILSEGRIPLKELPAHLCKMVVRQQKIIDRLYLGGNFFERQIETRLFGFVSGVALAVTGVALTIIGVACTAVAMVTLGSFKKVNTYAVLNMQAIGFAINQLHQGVLGVVFPSHISSNRYYVNKHYPFYRSAAWLAAGAAGVAAYRWTRA